MRRVLLPLVAALVLAAPANAATKQIAIKSSGFAPASLRIALGDSVTWTNKDTANHQIVANNGSFASPVLKHGQTYSHHFTTSGRFPYHDAIKPSLKGVVRVLGPPPTVTIGLSPPIVTYGMSTTISGQISTHTAGQNVTLNAYPYGQSSPTLLATVVTGSDGTYSYAVKPRMYTTYTVTWTGITPPGVIVQVAPKVTLVPGSSGTMRAQVTAGRSLAGRHLFLQRLTNGQWKNVAPLKLGSRSGRIFTPRAYLPKGISRIRVFLTTNQAGIGLLAAHSGVQTLYRA